MSAQISITYMPNGKVREFSHPREAVAFFNECVERGIPADDLSVVNNYGVSLTAYHNSIPLEIQNLIERLELAHGGNNVPRWRFIVKRRPLSTGTTYNSRQTGKVTRISISMGTNIIDAKGVVLHEFAHALTIGHHHDRTFYRQLFVLLRTFVSFDVENFTVNREFNYMKSSEYWYAEMYPGTIMSEKIMEKYRRPETIAARRLTKAEIAAQTAEGMFE